MQVESIPRSYEVGEVLKRELYLRTSGKNETKIPIIMRSFIAGIFAGMTNNDHNIWRRRGEMENHLIVVWMLLCITLLGFQRGSERDL